MLACTSWQRMPVHASEATLLAGGFCPTSVKGLPPQRRAWFWLRSFFASVQRRTLLYAYSCASLYSLFRKKLL